MFKTPILFLIFNRPELAVKSFQSIQDIKPDKLFIAADGPRLGNQEDIFLCHETREKVLKMITWPCQIITLFREKNLGCGRAISEAITWFFNNTEAGIIIEDDCITTKSFFLFCEKMLDEYKDNNKIGMIGGANFLKSSNISDSYFFSKYFNIWGWATWRDKWKLYDSFLIDWKKNRKNAWLQNIFKDRNISNYYRDSFELISQGLVDTWDTNWVYTLLRHDQLTITPLKNLVSNIGFTGTFSNSSYSHFLNHPCQVMDINKIIKPKKIIRNFELERIQFQNVKIDQFSFKIFLRLLLSRLSLLGLVYKLKRKFS